MSIFGAIFLSAPLGKESIAMADPRNIKILGTVEATSGTSIIVSGSNTYIKKILEDGTVLFQVNDSNVAISGNLMLSASQPLNNVALVGGMYDVGEALRVIDQSIETKAAKIKAAYEAVRFRHFGTLSAFGTARLNLTQLSTSGSEYFNSTNIKDITVDLLVDTNNDGVYTNDLASIHLLTENGDLIAEIEAAAASNSPYRFIAVNETLLDVINTSASYNVPGITTTQLSGALSPYAKLSDISSSYITVSLLSSSLTASNITNFSSDVKSQFSAGTNITINNGVISSTAGGDITAAQVTSALAPYATLSGVSSSFATSANITSALSPYLLSSTATSTYSTLTGVSGTFARASDISSSFVTNTNATSSLARLAAVNSFSANQIISGTLNITSSITSSGLSSSAIIYSPLAYVNLTSTTNNPTAALRVNGDIAFGNNAVVNMKGGSNSVAIGVNAATLNNTNSIIAIGRNALSGASGGTNIAIGSETLKTSSGAQNVAIGVNGMQNNTTGRGNTAVGYQPLYNNTEGEFNIALGYNPLFNNTSGSYNTAIGNQALGGYLTGSYNVAIGNSAGSGLQSGSYNVFIGRNTTINDSEKSVYISDNNGGLKLFADSTGLVTIPGDLTVSGNVILGNASADSITLNATTISLGNGTGILNIDSNTFYVDGANNRVGIGKTNPIVPLDVSGNMNVTGTINITTAMKLTTNNPLPAGSVGMMAVSGTNLYFHNGTSWTIVI